MSAAVLLENGEGSVRGRGSKGEQEQTAEAQMEQQHVAGAGEGGGEGDEVLSEAYVHSLASLGLERLQNEPGRLHAEAIAVDEVRAKNCEEYALRASRHV